MKQQCKKGGRLTRLRVCWDSVETLCKRVFHRENEIPAIDYLHSEQSSCPHHSFRYAVPVAVVCVGRLHALQSGGQFLVAVAVVVVAAVAAVLAESRLL